MTTLELAFPSGRFHATPWGRHVNEGAIEWPPSPWRILRGLIATWHLKAREIPEATMRSLVDRLSTLPVFHLPPATTAHTRQYQPYNEGKNEKTAKVFDTFVQVQQSSVLRITWPVDLSPEETTALGILASRLGYLGRAESLVIASLTPEKPEARAKANCQPIPEPSEPESTHETVRVICPVPAQDFPGWRSSLLRQLEPSVVPESPKGKAKPKAGGRGRGKSKNMAIPEDLFTALHADTGDLQAEGWNLPPGAQFVSYARPADAFAVGMHPRPARLATLATVARFALVGTVPPRITEALSVAGRIHESLCSKAKDGPGQAPSLTGVDASGQPLTGHQHAHILCEANGASDHITHITVWAEMGFDESARLALRKIARIWGRNENDLHLVLEGIGAQGDFPQCALFGTSRIWRSATPFVSTRHPKAFRDGRPKIDSNGWQVGSPGHDLLRLLSLHSRGSGAEIRLRDERQNPYPHGTSRLRSLQFLTSRHRGGGSRGPDGGAAFDITFPEERPGPFALGYGAHFGLGLFLPVSRATRTSSMPRTDGKS